MGGALVIACSPVAESQLKPRWFWASDDRQAAAETQDHFDKLYRAYVLERNRRAGLGQPDMPEPTALIRSRARLKEAKEPLRAAQRHPAQIATALRWGGAGCCLLGLIALGLTRGKPPEDAPPAEA
ncbi:hypothetical protein MalM25_31610 [Planctomycetes bacterium MalM25]|nr:hypothetical protein MalM25_31610 [Planctomycetes bacterium MalM25]